MARQSTLNVSLTPTLQDFVRAKVSSGGYESASEVVREGLRALKEREQAEAQFWSGVRDKVAVARKQIAAGKTVDGPTAMDQIIAELTNDEPTDSKASSTRTRARSANGKKRPR
jgi:antitoxin ParD1/3/4